MKDTLKIFFGAEATNPLLVLLCLLLAGLAQFAGMSTLLPAVTAIAGGDQANSSALNETVRSAVENLGITPTLGNLIVIVVCLLVLKAILTFFALSYAGISVARVATGMRKRLISAMLEARWSYYADRSGGRFANSISNDATRAGEAYRFVAHVVSNAIQAFVFAAVAVAIDWRIAALGIGSGAFIALLLSTFLRRAKRAAYKQTERTSDLTVLVVDILGNIKPLKTMHRYDHIVDTVAVMLKRLRRSLVNGELAKQGLNQGGDAVVAILVGSGAYVLYTYMHTPFAELLVSGGVFLRMISLTNRVQRFYQEALLLESSYIRTLEVIEEAKQSREVHTGTQQPVIGRGMTFEHVSFAHGTSTVVSDASFEIPAERISVLQGSSGSGKTTLIDLLTGLHVPASGRVLIGETPIQSIDMKAWRRMIGYVPQELNLLHTTVRENITLGDPSMNDEQILAALAQAGISEFVGGLENGLDTDVGEMGGKLAGGQRQRISLARALVAKPKVLILDEVTSALDPETEAEIVENIAGLRGAYTIIAITHRPAWTRIADRLYKVSHGKVTLETANQPGRKSIDSMSNALCPETDR